MKSLTASDKSRVVPKKFFVVMPFGSAEYSAKPTKDIAAGVLDGVLGISDKAEIIMMWYGLARDAILAMDGPELVRLNNLSRIQYDNPEYLVSNGMSALYRIFDKERTKNGSYSLAANLIDHILIGIKTAPEAEVLSEAKDLADTIEKHAEALRRSLKALPFDDKYDLRQAVESVTGRWMDESDIENFAGFSGRAVKNLTEFPRSYDGLSARAVKVYLDSDYDMEPGERIREAAALAPKAEAAALDYGWDTTQTEALVKVMNDLATLVQDFDAIKALSKKASREVASLSGDNTISYAMGYDRGLALGRSFSDNGTDDIKTVKGLAKRFADVFKDEGYNYKDVTLPAWERAIRKALKSISNTFVDEGEWLVKDKKLKIPPKSTLWISKYPLPEDVEARRKAGETTKTDEFVHSSNIKTNNDMDRLIKDLNLGQRYIVRRVEKRKFDEAKSKWAVRPSKMGHKLAASASVVGDPLDFQGEFMAKYSAAKPLLKLFKGTKRGKARSTETASYEGGHVILKDDFYEKAEKYGRDWAEAAYAHELGHVVETEVFKDIDSMAEAVGINVWDRKQLPFGTYNFSEGIADTFAVLLLKDPADLALLRSRWPKWEELTRQCAERVGVRLTADQMVAAKSLMAEVFDPSKPLKPNEVLTVYHGTPLKHAFELINGFDATTQRQRMNVDTKPHRGIFVAPRPDIAEQFGPVIFELDVRAKNLHGTSWSGVTERQKSTKEKAWNKLIHQPMFPKSFRPSLSFTMSRDGEPQALLIGLVSPKMIKRVRYKGQWHTRQEFLDLKDTTFTKLAAKSFSDVDIPREFRLMFHLPSQQVPDLGEQLAKGVLKGISGVTDAGPVLQLRMFSVNRNAMLIMPGQKTLQLNDMQPVAYSDPESLMADDMAVAQRLLGQGWDKRKVITRILQEAEKGPMKDWMRSWQRLDVFPEEEMASQPLNSVEDMAEAMFDLSKPKVEAAIESNKVLGEEFVKDRYDPLLDFENYFKAVRSGLSNLGKGFVWEGEWLVADKTLHIPAGSRLVILDKKPNSDKAKKLIEEHNLDKRYRIQYADPAKMERATHWLGRHAEKATKERWSED